MKVMTLAGKYMLHQLSSRGWSLDDLFSELTYHGDYVIAVITNRCSVDLSLTDLVEVAEDLARTLEVAPEPLMAMFLADRGAGHD